MTRTIACLLVILAGCESLENRFVYHPWPGDPRAVAPPPLQDLELRTADGVKIHARWCPHPTSKDVLLYCHGNAGNLELLGKRMRNFHDALDCSVLIFDYPGYGRSEGKPSEAGCYASAHAAYAWLTAVQKIDPQRIVLCGESLGGGVALELATRRPHRALVLVRTFTSVPDVAASKSVVLSSAPAVMVNRFESLKKISSCQTPIFIAHGDKDSIIPFAHAEKLRDACKSPVRFCRMPGVDHNDPLPAEFFRELRAFLDEGK